MVKNCLMFNEIKDTWLSKFDQEIETIKSTTKNKKNQKRKIKRLKSKMEEFQKSKSEWER